MSLTPAEIAAWDARRLACVLCEVGGHVAPVAGGWMACDVPGSWANYAAGLGGIGPVSDAALDSLVRFYAQQGRPAGVQITPYQDASLRTGLAERGFFVRDIDTILARTLHALPPVNASDKLRFIPVDPGDADSVADFVEVHLAGFYPNGDAPQGMRPIGRRVARSARSRLWVMEWGGHSVGSGGLELFEDGATLIAGAVLPMWRRRGIQQAFIRFRLAQAAAAGKRFVTVGSQPGGPTERNALRCGFSVAYTQIGLWNA